MDGFSGPELSETESITTSAGEWRIGYAPHPKNESFPNYAMAEAPDDRLFLLMPVFDENTKKVVGFSPYLVSENGVYISDAGPIPAESPLPEAVSNPLRAYAEKLIPHYEQALTEGKGAEGTDFIHPLTEDYTQQWRTKIRGESMIENEANLLAQQHFDDLSYTGASFSERMAASDAQGVYSKAMEEDQREVTRAAEKGMEDFEEYLTGDQHTPEAADAIVARRQGEELVQQTEQRLRHRETVIQREVTRGLPDIERTLGQEANASHIRKQLQRRQQGEQGPKRS